MDNIPRFVNESNTVYNYRVQFINDNKDTLELNEKIKKSKIAANIKFKKCKY